MAETVKVPGISKPLPKAAVIGGLAVTGVLIVVYYRKQSSAAAAGTATSSTGLASGTDTGLLAGDTSSAYPWDGTYGNTSDPYSMDSSTGQTYGNEGYYGGYGVQGSTSTSGQAGPPFSNNQQWAAYAIQQLTANASFSGNSVDEAIGLYLDGRELTVNQEDIIYAAIGVAGPVPVRSANGYPPNLKLTPSGGKPPGGKTYAHNPVSGLKAKPAYYGIDVSWDKSKDATSYKVTLTDQTGHRSAGQTTTVATSWKFSNLTGGHEYQVTVLANPAEKGAHAAKITARPAALSPQAANRR